MATASTPTTITPPLGVPTPVRLYVGDTWEFAFTYCGPDGVTPINLTNSIVTGNLVVSASTRGAIPLVLASISPTTGAFQLNAPSSLTNTISPDAYDIWGLNLPLPPMYTRFYTRVVITVTDSLGNVKTVGVQPINVVSP